MAVSYSYEKFFDTTINMPRFFFFMLLLKWLHGFPRAKNDLFSIIYLTYKKLNIFSNFLVFQRYRSYKDFVKFLKVNIQNSVITTSFSAVPQKKRCLRLDSRTYYGIIKSKMKKKTCFN